MKIDLKCTTSSQNDTGKVLSCIAHMQEVLGFDCANFTFELEKKEDSTESIAWPVLDYIPQQTVSIKTEVPEVDFTIEKKSEKTPDKEELLIGRCAECGGEIHNRKSLYCSEKCYKAYWYKKNPEYNKKATNNQEQLPTGKCRECGVQHTRKSLYCSTECYNKMYNIKHPYKNAKATKNDDHSINAGIETPVIEESKSGLHPSILPSSSVTKSAKDVSLNEKLQHIRETIPIKRTAPELKRDFS